MDVRRMDVRRKESRRRDELLEVWLGADLEGFDWWRERADKVLGEESNFTGAHNRLRAIGYF